MLQLTSWAFGPRGSFGGVSRTASDGFGIVVQAGPEPAGPGDRIGPRWFPVSYDDAFYSKSTQGAPPRRRAEARPAQRVSARGRTLAIARGHAGGRPHVRPCTHPPVCRI